MKNKNLLKELCRKETLTAAWHEIEHKDASGGVDKESISSFKRKLSSNITKLSEELLKGKWFPEPYLRKKSPRTIMKKELLVFYV